MSGRLYTSVSVASRNIRAGSGERNNKKKIKKKKINPEANSHQETRTVLIPNLSLKINHGLKHKPPTLKKPFNLSKVGVGERMF